MAPAAQKSKRLQVAPRGLLLAAAFAAGFVLFRISSLAFQPERPVALAKQDAEQTPQVSPSPDPQGEALLALQANAPEGERSRSRARERSTPPDAGPAQSYAGDDPETYVYTVRVGEEWSMIARRFHLARELLQETNPELWKLRGDAVRPGDRMSIPGLGVEAAPPPILYSARAGDSWEEIAGRFSTSYLDLILDNFKLWAKRGVDIRAGDAITVRLLPPEAAGGAASSARARTAPVSAAGRGRESSSGPSDSAFGVYTVQPGDTWELIAAQTGIDEDALKKVNRRLSQRELQAGDVVRISWMLQVTLTLRKAERRGFRGAAELAALPKDRLAALVARGGEVYKEQYCGVCHQLDSAGTRGMFGPKHDSIGSMVAERLADPAYSGAATDVHTYLYESITEPDIYYVKGFALSPHRMPTFRHIPEDDLEALVVFLAEQ